MLDIPIVGGYKVPDPRHSLRVVVVPMTAKGEQQICGQFVGTVKHGIPCGRNVRRFHARVVLVHTKCGGIPGSEMNPNCRQWGFVSVVVIVEIRYVGGGNVAAPPDRRQMSIQLGLEG